MTDPSLVLAWQASVAELEKSVARREQMRERSRDNHMRLQWELDLVRLSAIVQIRYGGFDDGTRRELVLPAGAIAYAESLESFLRNHPRTAELVDHALDGRSVRLHALPNLPVFPAVAERVHAPAVPPASPLPVPTEIPRTPPPTAFPAEPDHPPITVLLDPSSSSAPPGARPAAPSRSPTLVPSPLPEPVLPVPATQLAVETALEATARAEQEALFAAQVDAKLAEQREMVGANAARGSGSSHPGSSATNPPSRGPGAISVMTPSRHPPPVAVAPEYTEFELLEPCDRCVQAGFCCLGTTDPHTVTCVRCHRSKIKCSSKGYAKPSAPKKRKKPSVTVKAPSVVDSEVEIVSPPAKRPRSVTLSAVLHAESSRAAASRTVSQPALRPDQPHARPTRPISDLRVPPPPLSSSSPSASTARPIPRVNLRLPPSPSAHSPRPARIPGHLPSLRGQLRAGPPASMVLQLPPDRMIGRPEPELELPRLSLPMQIQERPRPLAATHAWYAAARSIPYNLEGLRRVRESLQARTEEAQLIEAQSRALLASALNNLSHVAEAQAMLAETNEHIRLEIGVMDAILEQVLPNPPPFSPASPSPQPEDSPSRS